jgi:DNA polymerase-4
VAIGGFDHEVAQQMSLFGQDDQQDGAGGSAKDLRQLSVTADEVRRRFGSAALSYGRDLRFREDVSDTMPTGKFDAQ